MSSLEWLVSAKFRLGAPIYSEPAACPSCSSGALDVYGRHASFCAGGGDLTARHNGVRDLVGRLAKEAQLSVETEKPHMLLDGSRQKPADVFFTSWTDGTPLAVDVTGVDVLAPLPSGYTSVMDFVEARADAKRVKYKAQCDAVGVAFRPFVFGSVGGFGVDAVVVIKELGRRIARAKGSKASEEIAVVRKKLSMTIQRHQAGAFIKRGSELGVLVY